VFAERLDTEGDVVVDGNAEFSGEEQRQDQGGKRPTEGKDAWGASMLGDLFLKACAVEERLEAGVGAKGIEGGFDGEFGHGESPLFVGLFKGIQGLGLLSKLGIENRGAEG